MRKTRRVAGWVVYQTAPRKRQDGPNAVCDAAEWDALEAAQPGVNRLIRAGIATEGEAERLARGTSGDPIPKVARPPRRLSPPAAPVTPPWWATPFAAAVGPA